MTSRDEDDEREDGETAPGPAPNTAFPEGGIDARTTEAGGEVSMSLEETNRVREQLGLKPLRTGESDETKRRREAETQAHAQRRDEQKSKETAEIAARIAAAKETRMMNARNASTKQLGEDEGDDLTSWISKSRTEEKKRLEEQKRKALELAKKLAEQDEDDEESEGDENIFKSDAYTSKELAGLTVRHGADDVGEGETMILTLRDSHILDDTRTGVNDDGDELENVLLAEETRRKRARTAATKQTDDSPFAEENDLSLPSKAMLGKYDEKQETVLTLNHVGIISVDEEQKKELIKRKLAATLGGVAADAVEQSASVTKKTLAEFMTKAEVLEKEASSVAFNKPKKRRKKIREKKIDLDELEADAPEMNELGSRKQRAEEGSSVDAALATERWKKDAQFTAAKIKAKKATDQKILAEMAGDVGQDEDDFELERALARSRRQVAKAANGANGDALVLAVAERRLAEERGDPLVDTRIGADAPGVVFSDTQEFVQGIHVADLEEAEDPVEANDDAPPPPPPRDEEMVVDDAPMPPPPPPPPVEQRVNLGGIGEASTASKGLAATLALLKDTGKLNETEMWDGRTNDKKPLALQRSREAAAIPSGSHEGKKFDFHLDKFDEFGRKMTPKEAFRDLCHKFHGIEPSKNKKEKRLKQYQEEMKVKKMAEKLANEGAVGSMESMKRIQQVSNSPFLMLDGKVRPGQSSNAEGKYATSSETSAEAGKPKDKKGRKAAGDSQSGAASSRLGAGAAEKVAFTMKPRR